MNVTNVSTLIAALGIETVAESITPSRLANILSQIVQLLQNVPSGDGANGSSSKLAYAVSSIGTPTRYTNAINIPYMRTTGASGSTADFSIVLPTATTALAGLLSASDKDKLDRLAISSISLSGNVLSINGRSFTLTPVGGGTTPPDDGDSGSSEGGSGCSPDSDDHTDVPDYVFSDDIIIQ